MLKTKTKVIALMMVVPLLLIFTMTSVVQTTKLIVDIPVSGIEIVGNKDVTVDVASGQQPYKVQTLLLPVDATNKTVTYTASAVEGKEQAKVKISSDGVVTPLCLGSTIITASAGDKSAKMQLTFTSSAVMNVSAKRQNFSINVGESLDLLNDGLAFEGNLTSVQWSSSNETVAKVDNFGVVRPKLTGEAVVTATLSGKTIDENSGAVTDKQYVVDFNLQISRVNTSETGVYFDESTVDEQTKVPTIYSMGNADFDFECDQNKYQEYGGFVVECDEQIEQCFVKDNADGTHTIKAKLGKQAQMGESYSIRLFAKKQYQEGLQEGSSHTGLLAEAVICAKMFSYVNVSNQYAFAVGNKYELKYQTDALSDCSVTYKTQDENVAVFGGYPVTLQPKNVGVVNVYLEFSYGDFTQASDPVQIVVVDPVTKISFEETTQNNGLESCFVIGGKDVQLNKEQVDGIGVHQKNAYDNATESNHQYSLKVSLQKQGNTAQSQRDLVWSVSDQNVATVTADGKLNVVGDGEVVVTAQNAYTVPDGEVKLDPLQHKTIYDNATEQVTLHCKKDAVNVYDYYDLAYATTMEKPIALRADVMLAPKLASVTFSDYANYLEKVTVKMPTTADKTYYENINESQDAIVRYCVNFTNDLYGNGFCIDGTYITYAKSIFGYSVFNGPLSLVQVDYNGANTSMGNASVKAQDNVVFAVLNDDVAITNVQLKGCSDDKLKDGGQANLSNLDYVGTVLEIVGDNCSVTYCRINNGRTAVRLFGKPYVSATDANFNASQLRVNATIANCILSYGREFLLKVGSNQFLRMPSVAPADVRTLDNDTPEWTNAVINASPYLAKANGDYYAIKPSGNGSLFADSGYDEYFYDNYVMTDLTLRDCVFEKSGLFSVGLESRFGGMCLNGWNYASFDFNAMGWSGVAGTSYPAIVRLQGDVRFYDWKKVTDVNSETLIEFGGGDNKFKEVINMDFSKLLTQYTQEHQNSGLTTRYNDGQGETDYVNGAIAFFGGGRNYSFVDFAGVNSNFNALSSYQVDVKLLAGQIPYASGYEPFRFLLYNDKSALSVQRQYFDVAHGNAYSWLSK